MLIPAVNGVGLSTTALALFAAIKRYNEPSRLEQPVFLAAVISTFLTSLVTAESLAQSVIELL